MIFLQKVAKSADCGWIN